MSQTIKDYSGQDLRGRNFGGQDLTEANFSYANLRGANFKESNLTRASFTHGDIRGADFNNSLLVNADFREAKAGLIYSRFPLAILTGISLSYLVIKILDLSKKVFLTKETIEYSWLFIAIFINFFILNFLIILCNDKDYSFSEASIQKKNLGRLNFILYSLCNATTYTFIYTALLLGAITLNFFINYFFLIQLNNYIFYFINLGIVTTLFTLLLLKNMSYLLGEIDLEIPLLSALTDLIWRLFLLVNNFLGAANFSKANLTDSDFTNAILINTNLRNANTFRACWIGINYYGFSLNIINNENIVNKNLSKVELITTTESVNKEFAYLDAEGINLKNKNLSFSNFAGANLNSANLQAVNLSGAVLKQTQLDGTDLTDAILTGAYIEDWGITAETKLDEIKCEYVYMHVPTKDNPDPIRKPDNRNEVFEDGDFADFIRPLTDTLDLYHNQSVDPRAIAIAFKELAENNPEAELRIVAMEVKGKDKFLLRAKTAVAADKSKLSAKYFSTYNHYKSLTPLQMQALLAEKDSRITRLENMVDTALQSPKFYTETHVGDVTVTEAPKKSSTFNLQGAQFGGGLVDSETVIAGQIGGNIRNVNQKQNLSEAAAEIQQLLDQLAQNNPTSQEVVAEAVHNEIKRNPTLKARLVSALKAGGLEALKAIFNHPLFSIPAETVKGWLEAE